MVAGSYRLYFSTTSPQGQVGGSDPCCGFGEGWVKPEAGDRGLGDYAEAQWKDERIGRRAERGEPGRAGHVSS